MLRNSLSRAILFSASAGGHAPAAAAGPRRSPVAPARRVSPCGCDQTRSSSRQIPNMRDFLTQRHCGRAPCALARAGVVVVRRPVCRVNSLCLQFPNFISASGTTIFQWCTHKRPSRQHRAISGAHPACRKGRLRCCGCGCGRSGSVGGGCRVLHDPPRREPLEEKAGKRLGGALGRGLRRGCCCGRRRRLRARCDCCDGRRRRLGGSLRGFCV